MDLVRRVQNKILERFSYSFLRSRAESEDESDDDVMLEMTVRPSDDEKETNDSPKETQEQNGEDTQENNNNNDIDFLTNLTNELNEFEPDFNFDQPDFNFNDPELDLLQAQLDARTELDTIPTLSLRMRKNTRIQEMDMGGIQEEVTIEPQNIKPIDIITLYQEYQQSLKKQEKSYKKAQESILKKNRLEHSIKLIKLFENVENYSEKVNARTHEAIIKKLLKNSPEKLTAEGRILKDKGKVSAVAFNTLTKRYQKLYSSHLILEDQFKVLQRKYNQSNGIKGSQASQQENLEDGNNENEEEYGFEDMEVDEANRKVSEDEEEEEFQFENDSISKPTKDEIFKGRGLKVQKSLISLNEQL